MAPQEGHERRRTSLLIIFSLSMTMFRTWVRPVPRSSRILSRASACARFLGKPSSMKPLAMSDLASLSSTMPMTISSGTSSPRSMYAPAVLPFSVPEATASLSMSPVVITGMPYMPLIIRALVPFPEPGGPRMTILVSHTPLEGTGWGMTRAVITISIHPLGLKYGAEVLIQR